ncbi:PAS domain-containing protein [Tenacibaculum caenipelagi]|uniref:PAS domain S-box-containing protein n=1 Tax=Tenacibaculum caenipelagi TaxID=1325435 RepID=A0A4R6TD70_9FLAO|nr:PAS domain-containing protein [Tenacibaculum caenipelagi]TDQ23741.1 PAS domain S-box-containing protein [Tenacibaculum caenipelagi]
MKNDLTKMMALDIYVSNLEEEKYSEISTNLQPSSKKSVNLLSWGIQDLFFEKELFSDLDTIKNLSKNFNWKNNLIKVIKENYYESLVLTDVKKKIIWVSDGFTKMTGYEKEYALNKTPRFLQGEETKETTRKRIQTKLLNGKPFKDVIINYRKDQSTYKCELHIIPLHNNNSSEITHFLALEKEVV